MKGVSHVNSKQVAQLFDLSIDTLRYYEKVGVVPPITRDKNGYRDYQVRDLNWIYLVKNLRKVGMSIESLQEFARLSQLHETGGKEVQLKQKQVLIDQLNKVNEKLAQMEIARDLLAYKIETYDDHIAKFKNGKMPDSEIEKLWEVKR